MFIEPDFFKSLSGKSETGFRSCPKRISILNLGYEHFAPNVAKTGA